MNDTRDHVRYYVARLTGPHADDAWHSLRELGPSALPELIEAFNTSTDTEVRASLVSVVNECRTPDAAPFLLECLGDSEGGVWKYALDGLVTLGTADVAGALAKRRAELPPDRHEWIDEAIEQIRGE